MLINLKLKNIALIEIIEINFEKGLNIFTGDSGSGKSLILDSLNVLFGGNNIPLNHLIRPGKENCSIQAKFIATCKVKDWLVEHGIQNSQSEIIISRNTYKKNNKILTKFAVNNFSINKKNIECLGLLLIDFAGQSDTILFNSQDSRKQIIDELGSKKLKDINLEIKKNWDELLALKQRESKEIQLFNSNKQNNFAVREMLKILEDANLKSPNEMEHLKLRESKLANNSEIRNCLQSILNNMASYRTEDLSVASLIIISIKQLNRIVDFDVDLQKFNDNLINMQSDLETLIFSLTSYLEQIDNDDTALEDIQSRLYFLKNLERSFALDLPNLIYKREQLKKNIEVNSNQEKINQFKIQIAQLSANLDNLFQKQSAQRRKIANNLELSVLNVLNYLGLENAKFSIEFTKANPSSLGVDNINFLFSANPDQKLAPLSKVISGGEMSRFLLAIKSTISKNSGSFFLDEIDSGLSGNSLHSLVGLIKKISKERQVLCITHQPFLAAAANAHYKVKKNVREGSTFTTVSKLTSKSERKSELTELIGGGFDEANDYASILIDKAAA